MSDCSAALGTESFEFDFSNPHVLRAELNSQADERLPLEAEYYVNDERISESFGHTLDPLLADLIDVALASYLTDRLAALHVSRASKRPLWRGRFLRIKVPVRNLCTWQRPDVYNAVKELLHFFTEDDWRIEFIQYQGEPRASESQGFLFSTPPQLPARVALYSGGLDSFAGTAQQMTELPDHSFILMSGSTNSRQRAGQRAQVNAIAKVMGRSPQHITVSYGRHWRYGMSYEEDASQRTRGFLFLSLGSATAITAGGRELAVYENGIGAINLPYDGTQIGISNSRAVHPRALLRMAEFVTLLTGERFQINNHFIYLTKAEMCRHPVVELLGPEICRTFSCDGYPVRTQGRPQCGWCTSCLLRRFSLESAGLASFDVADGYLVDLLSSSTRVGAGQLVPLKAMEWQAQKIKRRLHEHDPWEGLTKDFPELRKVETEICYQTEIDEADLRNALLRLYLQYSTEWERFSARAKISSLIQAA